MRKVFPLPAIPRDLQEAISGSSFSPSLRLSVSPSPRSPSLYFSGLLVILFSVASCDKPSRIAKYPDGTLRVRYEQATTHSTCLVAGVAMACNYLLGESRFTEQRIRGDLKRSGGDETRVSDLKAYLAKTPEKLWMLTLTGGLNDQPPAGLGYWLNRRGYPAICVINRDPGGDSGFNHAVVVIGFCANPKGESADIMVHYLDPSSVEPLHSAKAGVFEGLWARGGHAMILVVAPPTGPQDDRDKEMR